MKTTSAKTKETEYEESCYEVMVEKDEDGIDIVPIKSTLLSKMTLSALNTKYHD